MLRDMQYEQIKWAAFRDELQKRSGIMEAVTRPLLVPGLAMGLGTSMSLSATGREDLAERVWDVLGASDAAPRVLGAVGLLGAAGALGLAHHMGRRSAHKEEQIKKAFVAQLGRGVINAGLAATRMAGAPAAGTGAVRAGMKALGSSANLQKAVGGATLAAGAGAGVGYMAGRSSQPRGYGYY